jgi:hypothetical protein
MFSPESVLIGNNETMKHLVAAILVLAFSGPGIAKADDDCHVSMDRWKPREAVGTMATGQGWTVARIKIDDGCYEIRGTDQNGLAFKAKVDPETLEIVKFRHRDRDDDRHGARHERSATMENEAAGGTSSDTPLETTVRPKAIIK